VTDFFGGVAQVEVLEEFMPSSISQPPHRSNAQEPASRNYDPKPASHIHSSSTKSRPQATWDPISKPRAEKRTEGIDLSRAWAATALVGGLIIWSRLRASL
jgi:hypothetical protein